MHLLLSTGPYPFTADDIRPLVGLEGHQLDLLIEAGIASICAMSSKPVRAETWDVAEGEGGELYGTPTSVGELHQRPGRDTRWFRTYVYEPNPRAVEVARQRVVAWCLKQDDILDQLAAERLAKLFPKGEETHDTRQ